MENGNDLIVEELFREGKVKRTIITEGEDYYLSYILNSDSWNGTKSIGKGNPTSGKDIFVIDADFNIKYISNSGKEYGDEVNNTLLEDETDIRFASEAFSQYVSRIAGLPADEMKFKWMKNQTSLTINDSSITSLEDLVFFQNLTSLTLNNLNLDNLDGVEYCSKLNKISIRGTRLNSYNSLSEVNALSYLFIENYINNKENLIASIKDLKELKTLDLRDYQGKIKNFDKLKNVVGLETLTVSSASNLVNIQRINNLINLKSLNLSYCKINDISQIGELTNLTSLNLEHNQINNILPLSSLNNLRSLSLKGNTDIDANRDNYSTEELTRIDKIGEILDNGGTINLDIDKLKLFNNYTKLDLDGQNLTTLEPLDGMNNLIQLKLNNNQLTLEDEKSQEILKNMKNLEHLELRNNRISDVSVINIGCFCYKYFDKPKSFIFIKQ